MQNIVLWKQEKVVNREITGWDMSNEWIQNYMLEKIEEGHRPRGGGVKRDEEERVEDFFYLTIGLIQNGWNTKISRLWQNKKS